jgi:PAS domain S-box-containing protein
VRRVWTALTASAGTMRALSEQEHQLDDSYAALVRSQQDLGRVIESIPDGVIIHRAGTILFANPAWGRCLGFVRADQAVGCKLGDLVDPEDRAAALAWAEPQDETGDAAPREYRFRRRDGATVTLEISAAQRVEFAGAPSSLVVARDATERKRAETTVRSAEKQLELKLARADRLVALGTLAAGVAHEISNPLAYVMLNLETILEQARAADAAAPASAGGTVELTQQALEGAQRVRLIVNELKTLSRGEDRATGPVNLERVLAWSLNVADHQIRHRARVVREFGKVPLTSGNEARLGQVFLNLLINAAQSIPEGHAAANEITVVTRTDDAGRAVIEVRDTGCGIPPESIDRIFDPFFTTQPIGQGSGLGLAICHQIVTELHGEIEVESGIGTGTTFRVRLPALAVAPAPPPKPPEVPAPRRARILIIDDDVHVGRALGHVLRRHQLTVVSNGHEALDRLGREEFDVIFCDMMMPDLSGIDIYEAVRDRQPGLENRIVFMTGGAFTTDAREFLARVPNTCIEKPFARAAIDEAIGALVGA